MTESNSTFWSHFWTSIGVVCLMAGLGAGIYKIHFLATSIETDVTVADVIRVRNQSATYSYGYVFEATNAAGDILSHTTKMPTGWRLHRKGDIVGGRMSQSSGLVLSDKFQKTFSWKGTFFIVVGAYLGRRAIFGPVFYWIGHLVGFLSRLSARGK